MSKDKKLWAIIKEMLFTFLAISKILYWFETVTAINQEYLTGMVRGFLMQLLNRDLMIIIGVVIFFFLDRLIQFKKSKYSSILEYVLFYVIGYVCLIGAGLLYLWVMSLFFTMNFDSWGPFIIEFALNGVIGYLVVVIALNIKQYYGAKRTEEPAPNEDKQFMLKALLESGVLTQEEYDQKIEFVK